TPVRVEARLDVSLQSVANLAALLEGLADLLQLELRGSPLLLQLPPLVSGEVVPLDPALQRAQPSLAEAQLIVQQRAHSLQLGEAEDLRAPRRGVADLVLQLLDNHAGAPERGLLGLEDVPEDVVAHVEDAFTREAGHSLEGRKVPPLVYLSALQRRRLA